MPKEILSAYAEMYLKIYASHLIIKYTKMSLPSDEWFIDEVFPILEVFLSRVANQGRQSRHALRLRLTEVIVEISRESGRTAEDLIASCVQSASAIDFIRKVFKTATTLDIFYAASTFFEFAEDINPIEGRSSI